MKNNIHPVYDIAVLGANGGIGFQVVKLALTQGHRVTAILRTPSKLALAHPNLKIVQGDVMKPETLREHLRNKDAVISAIGQTSLKETTLYSVGNKNILDAIEKAGTSRAFFISASGLEVNPTFNFFTKLLVRFVLQKLLKNMYADLTRMEQLVKDCDQNWTIVRPPSLTNKALTGHYRFSINHYLDKCWSISRADVAHFMLSNIHNGSIYKKTVEVAY